jgi:hypothetical protein
VWPGAGAEVFVVQPDHPPYRWGRLVRINRLVRADAVHVVVSCALTPDGWPRVATGLDRAEQPGFFTSRYLPAIGGDGGLSETTLLLLVIMPGLSFVLPGMHMDKRLAVRKRRRTAVRNALGIQKSASAIHVHTTD